ncbi:MAG TPA: CDP-diacylglycerol--glycerol-3-phosphate 3-phosphatidyltransferase [Candidatus Babeliales bacterium]|nr:CDP-diacylglycerol--glycerol-3-phosphate 3-phosphatidyltransferase [Candidatus Babeliales bacterium]
MFNLPNILTLSRLILAPLLLPFLLVYYLPQDNLNINFLLSLIFIIFALTDFFDGYLARKYNLVSTTGKLLDPLADKFLVTAVLISLLAVHKIWFFWVLILICREFFIMGLRLFARESNCEIIVSQWGKLKTFAQCALLAVLIAKPLDSGNSLVKISFYWSSLELILLVITISLSIYSAYSYWCASKNKLFN